MKSVSFYQVISYRSYEAKRPVKLIDAAGILATGGAMNVKRKFSANISSDDACTDKPECSYGLERLVYNAHDPTKIDWRT